MLLLILLLPAPVGPPKTLITETDVVPARPVKVMLLMEIVSATMEGALVDEVKNTDPDAATRSMFTILLLKLSSTVLVEFWLTQIKLPVLRMVEPVVFKLLFTTLIVPDAALTSI